MNGRVKMGSSVPKLDISFSSTCTLWAAMGMFRSEARRQRWQPFEVEKIISAAACSKGEAEGIELMREFTGKTGFVIFKEVALPELPVTCPW
jgi:hypothetical protein